MKTVLLIAILLGFGATLAGAHFVPGIEHERLPSHTSVVANGGRSESFLIRLPADRLSATDGDAGGLRALHGDAAMQLPAQLMSAPVLVEHFKVRDAGGAVVGVAARHWSADAGGAATVWSLLIPSRGAFVLRAPGEPRGALETALRAKGYTAGKAWEGELALAMTADEPGALALGSGEFANLAGSYTESWTVSGIDETGEMRGTIELDTVTRAPEASVPQ
jgi:hypothetical protein